MAGVWVPVNLKKCLSTTTNTAAPFNITSSFFRSPPFAPHAFPSQPLLSFVVERFAAFVQSITFAFFYVLFQPRIKQTL
jgi:hypothetical protein